MQRMTDDEMQHYIKQVERRGKAESGGGGSGCLQRTGAAVGCGGQRRDIQHHSAEKGKMAEKTGGVIAWRL